MDKFQHKLTLVSAPAGYGKTPLVTSWFQVAKLPFTWLSLNKADNIPVCFLYYLIAATNPFDVGKSASLTSTSPQPPPPEAVVSILLNEIAACRLNFCLVLDDYHHINTPQIHKLIAFFLERQPSKVHLVLITRYDPLLPIARLRARGQVLEIYQEDLCFSVEEFRLFLQDIMQLDLPEDDVIALEQHTEGWIAGLQLAGLSLQKREDPHQFV